MLRYLEALSAVADAAGPPRARAERVDLGQALNRVVAADVLLDHDVPPFDRATMDGYAVASSRLGPGPNDLDVVGRVMAGRRHAAPLRPGETVAIMTGAPTPPGADAVVPVEKAIALSAGRVRLAGPVPPGDCVARRAEQARTGDVVARAGDVVNPGRIGALAAAGAATVVVAARPTVTVLCTGDELVPVDARPSGAFIRDSNGYALAAQAERAGGRATYLGIVRDEEAALRAAIDRALDADLVLVSGGVSMGDRDLVPAALVACGVRPVFHRWAVKPGGPLWFGVRGATMVFGLPGNPAAGFVGFELLGVPALRTRLGLAFRPRPVVVARCAARLPSSGARRVFVPVALRPGAIGEGPVGAAPWVAAPVRHTGSGDPFGLASADGFAMVPEVGAPDLDPAALGEGRVAVAVTGAEDRWP